MKERMVRWGTECLLWTIMALGVGLPICLFGLTSGEVVGVRRLVGLTILTIFGVGLSCVFFYIRQQWRAAGCPDTMRINL